MKTKQLIIKPLLIQKPVTMLIASVVLSSSLLASGCNNNDVNESTAETEPTATLSAVNETADNVTPENDNRVNDDRDNSHNDNSDNSDDKLNNTDTLDNKDTQAASISGDSNNNTNPLTNEEPSLVTNRTQAGTPEDTVKQALNTLYYGDVKKAASYYQVDITNFEEELANTQYAFQQTVESVTIFDTEYNADKTRATINGELMLKGQSEPAPLGYELQKIKGKWKILG